MTTVNLIPRHIFGLKTDVHSNVAFVDDQTVAYPAGHHIVVCSLDDKRQKFIAGTEASEGVTATALAPSRRFLAVAERSERALVSIFDLKTLKKRKVLSSADAQARSYVSMAFSADNQLLLTQGGAPDWMLTCWNWSKGKPVASVKAPLHVMAPHASPSSAMLALAGQSTLHTISGSMAHLSSSPSDANLMGSGANNSGATVSPPQVSACSFSDVDAGLVCVTGAGLVRFFRVLETAFRPLPSPRMETHVFLAHAWLKQRDDYLVAGSAAGDLMLFHGGEFVTRLSASPGPGKAVHSLTATTKGLLCGLSDNTVAMFSVVLSDSGDATSPNPHSEEEAGSPHEDHFLQDAAEILTLQRLVRVDTGAGYVATIAVSPNEDVIVVTTSNAQLLTFPYQIHTSGVHSSAPATVPVVDESASVAVSAANVGGVPGAATSDATVVTQSEDVEYVVTSFHQPSNPSINNGPGGANGGVAGGLLHVTGMDVCVRKPLLVTCGLDRTVRVWNYIDRTCEVAKRFNEEAFSVACHPSGLHLLVGFADKLRLLNILMDDIRSFKELPVKACRECQFSTGGHLFAAVNGNTIQVFSLFTGELVATLRGHNGKVRSLFWNADDSSIVSAGLDGAVYHWDLDEAKREAEFVQKGVSYYSALCNREGTAIYAVGGDRLLKEIEVPSSQLTKEFLCDATLGQLVLSGSQRLLFGAGAEPDRPGAIRAFKFPLTGESTEFQCLSAPVTRLRVSFDDQFLFAAGEDGAVCIFEVRDKEGRPTRITGKDGELSLSVASVGGGFAGGSSYHHDGIGGHGGNMAAFSEEILVTKSDLEEKNTLMLELKNKVDELMLHNEYQLRLKDMTYNENLKDLTEKFTHEIELEKNKYELLREDKNDIEMEYEEKIKQLEEHHLQQMQETEAAYQQKIMKEVERYQEVLTQREAQCLHWKSEQQRLVTTHDKYVADVTEDFEQRLNEDRQLRMQMEEEKDELGREYRETVTQVEADVDEEIETLKKKYEDKLQAEREATLRFKGENGIMKKKFSALQKDIEDQRDQIKLLLEKEKELIEAIKQLEREIQALKREIRARDETIGEKEKRIYDLKKKNQELEKFKFVLDYKIKELKRAIEPRENEIADMKAQIKEMDQELELFHKSNAQLDLLIGEQRQRINALQKAIAGHRQVLSDQQTSMRRFRCDLHECVRHLQSPKELALQVAQLYNKYVTTDDGPSAGSGGDVEAEIQLEYARQKQYLEKSVHVLKRKYAADAQEHQRENLRATSDNMLLIREINDIRSALLAAKNNLQMERATMATASLGTSAMNQEKAHGSRTLAAALEAVGGDPDVLIAKQRTEIEELRRAVKALEDKLASGSTSSRSGEVFPPIGRAVDG
ncbi:Cilia- and flagella-associated protein 57 [Phytophthora fragariae]|uniref:Cilia-and flagella-associated protein 57 n=1 Tax=Phytophthora fragariae TaxID=53985 RepID=A0A6A4BNV3_9STRA|nr:Cilia- and flagella-associated protein 57 [Phytophthora fragariae]KAE8923304.1 Cilia- and flagella-associated protein 57 [Phytophthora fragariae]KAE8982186.1 Cilia- and flagella-associated protein 57 [Phytophthora fragariae]KAE9070709.1 Cilia- and flagella-associated protein 57 [Phytophthora fragariae]KAE9073226.1 Cilia- and flagella-associated protein 57 [Phytophthora fragariae]